MKNYSSNFNTNNTTFNKLSLRQNNRKILNAYQTSLTKNFVQMIEHVHV